MTPLRIALAWSALILVLCSVPGSALPPPPFELISPDKLAHVALFAVLGVVWLRVSPDRPWRVLLGGIAFGVAVEVWQGLLPTGRSPESGDVMADAVGMVIGVAAGRAWRLAR